jgi:hypothetical protein
MRRFLAIGFTRPEEKDGECFSEKHRFEIRTILKKSDKVVADSSGRGPMKEELIRNKIDRFSEIRYVLCLYID